MEKGIFEIKKIEKSKLIGYSSITLAFIGDAVHSLYVRNNLIVDKDDSGNSLNRRASSLVCAKAQEEKINKILPILTEEEMGVYKRARNAKKGTRAKNSSVATYNNATGFEAVIGYLYLLEEYDRLNYLLAYEGEKNEG